MEISIPARNDFREIGKVLSHPQFPDALADLQDLEGQGNVGEATANPKGWFQRKGIQISDPIGVTITANSPVVIDFQGFGISIHIEW